MNDKSVANTIDVFLTLVEALDKAGGNGLLILKTQMDKPLREFLEICGRNRVGFIHLEKEKLPT